MNKNRFTLTKEQQEELQGCLHVRKVSTRMVQYTADFKRHALREREKGMQPRTVFRDAGIPDYFGATYAVDRINEWRRLASAYGDTHFDTDTRGREGSVRLLRHMETKRAYRTMTDSEKITYLEARTEALEYIARHFELPPSIHRVHSSRRRKK